MLMNHIENMGWITYLIYTESSTDYNIAKDFGQVRLETIETYYRDLEISTLPTDNIQKLKFLSLCSWIFGSSNESDQYFLAKERNNRYRSGPLAWKLITTKILRGVKHVVCYA